MSILLAVLGLITSNGLPPTPGAGAEPTDVISGVSLPGFTRPAQEALLGPLAAGRIAQNHAAPGRVVRRGDLLSELESASARARLSIARAKAESTLEIELAHSRLDRARAEQQRLASMPQSLASAKELLDARSAVRVAEIELALAEFARDQAAREVDQHAASVAELEIRAPFDGVIVDVLKEAGESVEAGAGFIRVVALGELEVTAYFPSPVAARLRVGAALLAEPDAAFGAARRAIVTHVNPVADSASQTTVVTLRVENQDLRWMGGMAVTLRSLDESAAARPDIPALTCAGRAAIRGTRP